MVMKKKIAARTWTIDGKIFCTKRADPDGKRYVLTSPDDMFKQFGWGQDKLNAPVKGGWYCWYCFLFDHLTRGYVRGLVKTLFVKFNAAKGKDGILTNHSQTRYHQDACVTSKALLSTHINPNTRIDAALSTNAACSI